MAVVVEVAGVAGHHAKREGLSVLRRIERFLPSPPQDRKVLIHRGYDESEHELVGALVREFLELGLCEMICYDPPYEVPEAERPSWLQSDDSYCARIADQTQEQIDWICDNAATRIGLDIWQPTEEHWVELTAVDVDTVYFEARLSEISIVTSLSSYRELDRQGRWEVKDTRKFFQRPEPLPEGLLDY